MKPPALEKVVFLDKDGVINQDSPDYIKSWSEVAFIPGSLEAIRRLTEADFSIILISNQSAVNRNLMTREGLDYIFSKLTHTIVDHGGKITDIFYCPHTPEEGCDCRKPRPGLIHEACRRYTIDLSSACMIGDSARDMECGKAAGCGYCLLVKTGNGEMAEKQLLAKGIFPEYVAADLLDAARWLETYHDSDPAA
jgi:D-glycero-D-manno-heptose 1,7-bisphosphate phosphatase